eukprot:c19945_g1_i2.p1 GENE.c19945_g1_i2~~c19945_g1_i2.p1  ORF type:complete len:396 (-),score=100.19 c19945_g1_i2:622-1719(-)
MMECVRYGHEIIALAHLRPPDQIDELDSWMFQSVGSVLAQALGNCMELPMFVRTITGTARTADSLEYAPTAGDEVENLMELLEEVLRSHPEVEAVSSGAILSDYQRLRVESVCSRLGLTSLAYLWQLDQRKLLTRMIDSGLEAILVKVAGMGLDPKRHLGKSLRQMQPILESLNDKYGSHVCGEGGEFESIVLDCPLFRSRIILEQTEIVIHSPDAFAPVAFLKPIAFRVERKEHVENIPEVREIATAPEEIAAVADAETDEHSDGTETEATPIQISVTQEGPTELLDLNSRWGEHSSEHSRFDIIGRGMRSDEYAIAFACGGDPSGDVSVEAAKVLERLVGESVFIVLGCFFLIHTLSLTRWDF